MTGFEVVPPELRAAAGQVEPLAAQVESMVAQVEPTIMEAGAFHPEFVLGAGLEAFGSAVTEAGQQLAQAYAQHGQRLGHQASAYEQAEDHIGNEFKS